MGLQDTEYKIWVEVCSYWCNVVFAKSLSTTFRTLPTRREPTSIEPLRQGGATLADTPTSTATPSNTAICVHAMLSFAKRHYIN